MFCVQNWDVLYEILHIFGPQTVIQMKLSEYVKFKGEINLVKLLKSHLICCCTLL